MKVDTGDQPDGRDALTGFLRLEVYGPKSGPDELIGEKPTQRYLAGVLYPRGLTTDATLGEGEVGEEDRGSIGEELPDDPVTLANQWMPSSAGLSFYLASGNRLKCAVWGAEYVSTKNAPASGAMVEEGADDAEAGEPGPRPKSKGGWQRRPLADDEQPEEITISAPEGDERTTRSSVFAGKATVYCLWRPMGDGYLVTVTLVNNAEQSREDQQPDPGLCLFQVGMRCTAVTGTIGVYPAAARTSRDREEEELRLLHRRERIYAVGHGCAASWDEEEAGGAAGWVAVDFLPVHDLPGIVQKTMEGAQALDAALLADESTGWEAIQRSMGEVVGAYEAWLDGLPAKHADIPPELAPASDRLLAGIAAACGRMRAGIALLADDPVVRRAFRLANRAMLMQRRHSAADFGGERRKRNSVVYSEPDYTATGFAWWPFQLAFMLLVLPSLADEESEQRELVDLLWFPTGGGKTEAYLGLAAFAIFLRRLRDPRRGAGTAVLTRYTLRLLTSQQFQRTAAVLCACESIRSGLEDDLGDEPITLGLWIGGGAVPNTFQDAKDAWDELRSQTVPESTFQLERCPWCGTEIVPAAWDEDPDAYGIDATTTSFRFFCPSEACPFHEGLPVSVIDEDLYRRPPTMLIGTIDKFARLAWVGEAGVFFGDDRHDPPSLVIQDELHLLAGPLGTVAGVYETAIQALVAMHGAPAKIVASTATIRRADDQSLGLFGQNVGVFPPPGLEAGDSFFAQADREHPGRRYVGLMAPSHTMKSTIRNVAAALLQGPAELDLTDAERDAFWTLVLYHNSLRELGGALALARDDIPARLKVIAPTSEATRRLPDSEVVELTGNVPGKAIPGLLARIEGVVPGAEPVSVVLATNMLSVGVDIRRLTLMLVNGQPKLTSEYIQATSRVGRSVIPGLVIACYSPTKPRDRSHYETFYAYHQSLYRHVEPSSVTPFSLPARQRALHAALVILVRHGLGLSRKDAAGDVLRTDIDIDSACEVILDRVAVVDPEELEPTREQLERLVDEWKQLASAEAEAGRPLYYDHNAPKTHARLLRPFGSPEPGWETLNSMRNVDRECAIRVQGEGS